MCRRAQIELRWRSHHLPHLPVQPRISRHPDADAPQRHASTPSAGAATRCPREASGLRPARRSSTRPYSPFGCLEYNHRRRRINSFLAIIRTHSGDDLPSKYDDKYESPCWDARRTPRSHYIAKSAGATVVHDHVGTSLPMSMCPGYLKETTCIPPLPT